VIAFVTGQSEQPFLENRIAAVPQSDREANCLMTVADARYSILSPAIYPGPGVVMREVFPGGPVRTVVFPHRSPGALADVWTPLLPVHGACARLLEACGFGVHRIDPAEGDVPR